MKLKLLLSALMITCLSWLTAKATETEPNNTKATANTLTLNSSNSGAIGAAADEDWWVVTTTGDGKLDVTITISNSQYIRCWIYDNDGVTQLNYAEPNSTATLSTDGLATGTYYVRLVSYYSGGTPAYTISNTLTVPAQANDVEPNGTRAQAKVFPLGGTRTGHVNYYYNLVRDSADWYKITTTGDGRLDITITPNNGQYIRVWLFDNDGVTQLNYSEPSSTVVQSTDGLAAGTYYLRITSYYGSGFIPYTISNTFTPPAQANDLEPNDTKAQALTLGLNSSTTGHINYYYNNARDGSDWYKVTTTADGRLRLRVTPANGQYIRCWLYDNDGATQLNYFEPSSTADLNTDGLAAGTYYILLQTYYSSGYIPYILEDSLFSPTEANDVEPNGTLAQATAFNLNSTKTGHINYYYNLLRDDDDWYKITTTLDGMIGLTMTSGNGQYVQVWLYDNDGATQLNYMAPYGTSTINTDGLAAGTYYVRIHTYYGNGFIPYTLSNTFTPYTYTNDGAAEPNDAAYQAKTIPANGSVTGHVNFYQNGGTRNTADWWKINYTGSGGLTINLYDEAWKFNGNTHYKQIWIYKDTAASAIYYGAPYGDLTINLTSLTQGYYWIKVTSYYGGEHISYSLANTFTQVTKASIKPVGADTAATCSNTNTLAFKCTKSQAPYTVQLYRYNVAYGSPRTITNNATFTYTGLPNGAYYATAYGDGATGTAFGKSPVQNLMPPVTGTLSTTNITQTSAKTNWTTITCAKFYVVQYHKAGDSAWLVKTSNGNVGSATLTGLTANTTYRWRVQAADSVGNISATSKPTDSVAFTTATLFVAGNESGSDLSANTKQTGVVTVYPNPASSQVKLSLGSTLSNTAVNAAIKDMNGNIVWTMQNTVGASLNAKTIDVSKWPAGMYMLVISATNNQLIANQKVIISR